MSGEHEALIRSFAGEPILHEPRRGRVIGVRAFEAYITELGAWLSHHNMSLDPVDHVFMGPRGFEEVVIHLDGEAARVHIPVAIVADRQSDGRLVELRIYHSIWALTGRHLHRPPLLQHDPDLRAEGVVAEYQRARGRRRGRNHGDVRTERLRPRARGHEFVHRGRDDLRAFYERLFSNGGGIALERCALVHDGRACALEYNVVGWGRTTLAPEAGVAVYVQGEGDKLGSARIYDDVDPPLPAPAA
jgi:hypothetical protein